MENLVPLGTGNSRFMKSNISPNTTLAQLIQMLNNGTFPYDIGPINPAGISQQGTPLNKATLLQDATAALYGLGSDAVPDDVLAMLSAAALATKTEQTVYEVSTANSEISNSVANSLGPGKTFTAKPAITESGNYDTSSYAATVSGGSYGLPASEATSVQNCWAYRAENNNELYFVADANPKVLYYVDSGSQAEGSSTQYYFVTGTLHAETIGNSKVITSWQLKDVLGEALPAMPQIVVGTYVGTGVSGETNPNTLTVDFKPKLWGIFAERINNSDDVGAVADTGLIPWGVNANPFKGNDLRPHWVIAYSDTSVSWYSEGTGSSAVNNQKNNSAYTYYYIIVG